MDVKPELSPTLSHTRTYIPLQHATSVPLSTQDVAVLQHKLQKRTLTLKTIHKSLTNVEDVGEEVGTLTSPNMTAGEVSVLSFHHHK